jgi:hypothetical protein
MGAVTSIRQNLQAEPSTLRGAMPHVRIKPVHRVETPARVQPLTVGALLADLSPVRRPRMLTGVCADGLPFLIELTEPDMGAILVGCEKGTGKTHQLQVMAESAVRMSSPRGLQVGVLTFKPGEWRGWETEPERRKHLQGIYAWYDPWAERFIQDLVDLAEARQEGHRAGADVLMVLDDLNFVEELSYEAQVNLHWLLEYGSQSQVWLVGALNAHQAVGYRYWVEPFRTRIIGGVKAGRNAEILAMRPCPNAETLQPGEFCIWTGHHWQVYRLPLLGD